MWAGTRFGFPAGLLLGPLVLRVALKEVGILGLSWLPGVPPFAHALIGTYAGGPPRGERGAPPAPYARLGARPCSRVRWFGLGTRRTHWRRLPRGLPRHRVKGMDSVAVRRGEWRRRVAGPRVQMLRLFAVVLAGALLGQL